MELAVCFRKNTLNYFAIYCLKSKFCCFAAFFLKSMKFQILLELFS